MYKIFGSRLRFERKKQGLSAEILASTCGISRSYIVLIESGKRLPSKKVLPKIAAALNLNVAEVLNWYLEDKSAHMKKSLNLQG